MLKIDISRQRLYFFDGGKVRKAYPVSTSKFGIGNREGSFKTPLGLHRISGKIGANARPGSVFKRRRDTKRIANSDKGQADLITSRILRLEGLQSGLNKGRGKDSFKRCIYIHGTPDERSIGKPASRGCIRMKNRDIIELFNLVKRGTLVKIEA